MSDSITILAVGDIMLGENPACDGFGVASHIEQYGPLFPFIYCREVLRSADILFGNLEVVISGFPKSRTPFEQSIFRAQPVAIEGLVDAGFSVLSLATNHIMQHGQRALDECLTLLDKARISVIGIKRPEMGIENFEILERGGLKIGFLGYNLRPLQYFMDPPSYAAGDASALVRDIAEIRPRVDLLVVSVHWGDEFIEYPSVEQVQLAHRMVDAGANLVLGHHPHVIQGVESYGEGLIAYSLGNFVFDMWQPYVRRSMVLKCVLSKRGHVESELIPVQINRHWQPEVVRGNEADARRSEFVALRQLISEETNLTLYRSTLLKRESQYRREVLRWYLTHLLRYRPDRLIANFGGALRRRLSPGQTAKRSLR